MPQLSKLVSVIKGDTVKLRAYMRAARGRQALYREVQIPRERLATAFENKDLREALLIPDDPQR